MRKRPSQLSRYVNLVRHIDNWWVYLGVKAGLVRRDPLILRCRNGVRVEVPRRLFHLFKEIFFDDSYFRGVPAFQTESPTIIDVGANLGFFSLQAVSRFPKARVFAVEAVPRNVDQLRHNLERNPDKQVTCVPKAVFGTSGSLTLHLDENVDFPRHASVFELSTLADAVTVDCLSLPDLLAEYDVDTVDLLKLDCEGSEFSILYSCPDEVFPRIRRLAMEVHAGEGNDENIDAVDSFLQARGYRTETDKRGMLWAWRDD